MRRILISAIFDASTPGGGNEYSFSLAREWLRRGCVVHVLTSTFTRKLGDLEPFVASQQLRLYPISDYGKILLGHAYEQGVHDRARDIIQDVQPDSIHIHNFQGLLGAVWAAVESGRKTLYAGLDFGMVCLNWYLYDGSGTPCEGPAPGKCRDCLLRQHKVPFTRRLLSLVPFVVFRWLKWDAAYHKQFAWLDDYHRNADAHLEKLLPLLPRFDGIVTISPAIGEGLRKFGVSEAKIHYSVQGLSAPSVVPTAIEPSGGTRLIFLGHMAPIKGLGVVAEALSRLPPDLDFLITVYGPAARDFVKRQPMSARRYLAVKDFLVGDEVERDLVASDGVVIPSLWQENSPYALLRALSVGRPVLASRYNGFTHLLRSGENGFLLPPGDSAAWAECLLGVARDPALLRRMRGGCSFSKTVTEHAQDVENVLASL
ncbi:MAG TPA: glycosyltransferase [Vicinamibacterales bacterium]|nr:glycosyltransferase [Vicinamibacterales bacterium]